MGYIATLLIIFSIAAISAMALNLIIGYAGQLSVTQGALMAIGAYTAGLLSVHLSLNPLVGVFLGAGIGSLVAMGFAAAALRLTEYDYVLVALVLQMMVVEALRRWTSLTGGSTGLLGIERPEVLGSQLNSPEAYAAFTLVLAFGIGAAMFRVARSPYALTLRGFRDSEASVAALGKNTTSIRLGVGLVTGLGAGLAGALQASFIGFITPSDFSVYLSILLIVYLIVGGMGNMAGALLGIALLLAIPEVIGEFRLVSTALQGPVQRIIYGVIIMVFIAFRPQGILPEKPIFRFQAKDEASPTLDESDHRRSAIEA